MYVLIEDILLVVQVLPWLSPRWLVLQKTTQFGISVFLETQEMNFWGNLQASKCDISHIFMRTLFVLRRSSFPLLTLQFFFEAFLPQAPLMFCKTEPFSLTLQPCNPDFLTPAKTDFKKKVSFWLFSSRWKFARKRSLIKSFDELNTSMKITSYIFHGMLKKLLLLWKFWKIIRKTILVAFLLKLWAVQFTPPITTAETDSTAFVSFVCS